MVLIWGSTYTLVKVALSEIPPNGFNTLRLIVASAIFLCALAFRGLPRIPGRDWLALAGLGIVGHFLYQLAFVGGIARTTASNSALILGCSPVMVALGSAMAGHERVAPRQWAGVLLSLAGVYLVVGSSARFGGASLLGDLLSLGCVVCWAIYTVASQPLLERHSPLVVTGLTMAIGTVFYVPAGLPDLLALDWGRVSLQAWTATVLASVLSLNVGYLIWYTGVQRIGNLRTSAFSNVTPIVAMAVAAVFLGERFSASTIGGAVAIVGGVAVTRLMGGSRGTEAGMPAEE